MKGGYQQLGITLIEMLLVIAVIGVIAAMIIRSMQSYSETLRTSKAALEVQQVLEAALAYHTDYVNNTVKQWPAANSNLTTSPACSSEADVFVTRYIPNAQRQGTWGGNYCWDQDPAEPEPGTSSKKFWVAIKVPGQDIANRIAAHLPNAVTTENPTAPTAACTASNCYVKAEAVAGLSSAIPADIALVKAVGYCDPEYLRQSANRQQPSSSPTVFCGKASNAGDTTKESDAYTVIGAGVSCPPGFGAPKIFYSPNFLTTPWFRVASQEHYVITRLRANSQSSVCTQIPGTSPAQYTCAISLDAAVRNTINISSVITKPTNGLPNWTEEKGSIGASYTVLCQRG